MILLFITLTSQSIYFLAIFKESLHDYDFRNGNVFRENDLVIVNLIQPQEKAKNGNALAYPKAGSTRIEKPVFGLVVKSIRNDRKYIHPQVGAFGK